MSTNHEPHTDAKTPADNAGVSARSGGEAASASVDADAQSRSSDAPLPRKVERQKLGSWTHPVIYAGVRTAAATAHIAGIDRSIRAVRAMGGRFAKLPFNAERIERARDNIAWCFPDWPRERVEACSIDAYRHLFALAVEVAAAPRLLASDTYAEHIRVGDIRHALKHIASDRPTLLVAGHSGNWELLGATLAVLGVPIHALYRPLDMKPLDDWTRRTRGARGMVLMDKFGAAQRMPDILEAGGDIGFIADQNAGARGLFVPFFDRLASAYKAIGVMAVRYNATVVCGQAIRTSGRPEQSEGDGPVRSDGDINDRHAPRRFTAHAGEPKARFSYDIRLNDIITPDDWADQPDPVFYITARYRRAIEDMVRAAPEQYLWMHRYWKSRPKFERDRKPFPPRLRQKIESLPWMTPERVERIVERSAVDAAAFIEQREAKRKRRAKAAAQASPA